MLTRNGPVTKSVESVLRPKKSILWSERFVKKVSTRPGVKESERGGSYEW